jgi:ABC-type Mn2+/Zn2+ transport system ATPase subunit
MRLRYFRIRGKDPHKDTKIVFGREDLLGLEGSLHFLVGINGTGKSRLLQALVETLMCLENNTEPSYFVTLAYDLLLPGEKEPQTILFYKTTTQAGLFLYEKNLREDADIWQEIETESDILEPSVLGSGKPLWERGTSKNWVSMENYLPSAIMVYTSGAVGNWEKLFAPKVIDSELYALQLREAWSAQEVFNAVQMAQELYTDSPNIKTVWVRGEDYRAALLAAVLHTASQEFDNELRSESVSFSEQRMEFRGLARTMPERYDDSFRAILDEVDWLYPVTVSMTTTEPESTDWQQLVAIATSSRTVTESNSQDDNVEVIKVPSRSRNTLHFDLRTRIGNDNLAKRLLQALTSSQQSDTLMPFEALRRMLYWQRRGVFKTEDIRITLKKLGVSDPIPLENLSDGERMFLGRIALMDLINESENVLVILDEPETHFNDFWKREIVDIMDNNLERKQNDILITTHSSIALTDAFDLEITLLRKDHENDDVFAVNPVPPTFGASPTEVLRDIFTGRRSVGERAIEYLDTLIFMLNYPSETALSWQNKPMLPTEKLLEAFLKQSLKSNREILKVQNPVMLKLQERRLTSRLKKILEAFFKYGQKQGFNSESMLIQIAEVVLEKIGSGSHEIEIRRKVDNIKNENTSKGIA